MSDPLSRSDPDARWIAFRAGDIKARLLLIDLAESVYSEGNLEGCAALMHAEYYLSDRDGYALNPPPKMSILVKF